ncbi:WXG100 family type VII secretion target [Amycolatopsis sp. Hca4]|uniref:WXG100 family type VII secretion target n=1 Tax=Amycolatopsis sp. Hca4 TaxID=2742131 RepID=UPI001591ABD8|nr:hypothetical protein [Amycolatopsis sp. Hca4]QKV73994.1 hypothetical protein HUT10_09595 [Amycolatopsis sp. Hca4]
MGAPEPPPPVVDPDLQALTFDQLAQLVEEVSPDALYERAAAFDTAMARFEHLRDDLGTQTRHLWEAWSGRIAEAFDDVVRQVSGRTGAVVQAMAEPGYGAVLRRAGDALAQARRRMQDLRAQNRQNDLEAARQVLYDLGTAYRDLGATLAPVPDAGTGVPAAVAPVAAPGGVPAGAAPGSQPAAAGYPGGGAGTSGAGGTPTAALAALAHPAAQGRIVGVEPVSAPAVTPVGAGASGVLGRAPSPGEAVEPRPSEPEAAAVLGRPWTGAIRQSPAKRKENAARCAPEPARGEVPTTSAPDSAPEGEHAGAAARSERTVEAVAEPSAVQPGHPGAGPHATSAPAAYPVPGGASVPGGHGVPVVPGASAVPVASASVPGGHGVPVVPGAAAVPAASAPAPSAPVLPAAAPTAAPAGPSSGAHAGPGFPTAPAAPGHGPLPGSPAPGGSDPAAGIPRGPGALPASPAFQPVTGSLDAAATGMPPMVSGVPGSPRVPGDHVSAGGYAGPMFGGAVDHDEERDRDPADFLAGRREAWTSAGDGAPVLGRPVVARPEVRAAPAEDVDLEKLGDPEELQRVLGRLGRRAEG